MPNSEENLVKYRDLLRDVERALSLPRPLVITQHKFPWAELRDGAWSGAGETVSIDVSELVLKRAEVWQHIEQFRIVLLTQQGDIMCHLVPWPVVWKERESERVNAPGLEGIIWRAAVAYRLAVFRHFLYGIEE